MQERLRDWGGVHSVGGGLAEPPVAQQTDAERRTSGNAQEHAHLPRGRKVEEVQLRVGSPPQLGARSAGEPPEANEGRYHQNALDDVRDMFLFLLLSQVSQSRGGRRRALVHPRRKEGL